MIHGKYPEYYLGLFRTPIWVLLLVGFSAILGLWVWYGAYSLELPFLVASYATIFLTLVHTRKNLQDPFNILNIILVIGLIRFSLPGLLYFMGANPPARMAFAGVSEEYWRLGHALALFGLLSVVMGWMICPSRLQRLFHRIVCALPGKAMQHRSHLTWSGILLSTIGFIGLLTFIVRNARLFDAVVTGRFRATEITAGTGVFFQVSLAMIPGVVLLVADFLFNRRLPGWIALAPAVLGGGAFFILGGRARAFTGVACGLLLLWHRSMQTKSLRLSKLGLVAAVIGLAFVLVMYSYAGQLYRGGGGLASLGEVFQLTGLADYVNHAVWVDYGQLHSIVGAVVIGPGVLGGRSFLTALGPLGRKLGLSGKSAGMFLAQDYWRRRKLGWGYHATIIGESYLNFGLIAVFIIGIFYGIWLRTVASLLRNLKSPVALSIAALLAVYSLRVFYESSAKVFETFVVVGFLLAAVAIFSLFPVKSTLPHSELRFSGSSSASKDSFPG